VSVAGWLEKAMIDGMEGLTIPGGEGNGVPVEAEVTWGEAWSE
jgi:hypothetical protein